MQTLDGAFRLDELMKQGDRHPWAEPLAHQAQPATRHSLLRDLLDHVTELRQNKFSHGKAHGSLGPRD